MRREHLRIDSTGIRKLVLHGRLVDGQEHPLPGDTTPDSEKKCNLISLIIMLTRNRKKLYFEIKDYFNRFLGALITMNLIKQTSHLLSSV